MEVKSAPHHQLNFWVRYTQSPVAVWALVLGVLVHIAGFFAFSISIPHDSPADFLPPEIYYTAQDTAEDAVLAEQSALMDFEPLFLPTSRNASAYLGWEDLVERTEPFSALPPELLIGESQFPPLKEEIVAPVDSPVNLLEVSGGGNFGAFGQLSAQPSILEPRSGSVEIYRDGESQLLVHKAVTAGLIQESIDNLGGISEWRLTVGASGLVGDPFLVTGSGVETVDEASSQFLVDAAPSWGLAEGYYRVVIGP
ncbi:MAG: hypothetical protein AAFX93_18285 [Verrucomicrobiota bacterium]